MPTAASQSLESTDPKLVAGAIAAGGKLVSAAPTSSGRLLFVVSGIAPDFEMRVLNDEVSVSLRSFIAAMESVLTLISRHQRGQR